MSALTKLHLNMPCLEHTLVVERSSNAFALGIPPQVVMKWTGHSDYKAMKPNIDIADDIKANAMSKFNQL